MRDDALNAFSNVLPIAEQPEVPPNPEARCFNECEILGAFDRNEKGNLVTDKQDPKTGNYIDLAGR